MICVKRREITPACKWIKSYKPDKLLLNDYVNNYRSQIKDNMARRGPDNPFSMQSLSVRAHSLLTAWNIARGETEGRGGSRISWVV